MPHLAPINWLIIWFFIWSSFFLLSIVFWWKFKSFYSVLLLDTKKIKKMTNLWVW